MDEPLKARTNLAKNFGALEPKTGSAMTFSACLGAVKIRTGTDQPQGFTRSHRFSAEYKFECCAILPAYT